MIEEQIDEIVTDVKQNLTSLFNRGEQLEQVSEKSEELKSHSTILRRKARQIRIESERGTSMAGLAIFACLMVLFFMLQRTTA